MSLLKKVINMHMASVYPQHKLWLWFVASALVLSFIIMPTHSVFANGTVYLPIISTDNGAGAVVQIEQPDLPTQEPSLDPVTGQPLFYVSKAGSNANGVSWASAWNELDQIDWRVIKPGSLILIDGGLNKMVYSSSLRVLKSGTEQEPITIRLAMEEGRNGQAIFDGGRGETLPYCGQTSYSGIASKARADGIAIANQSWIVIDGVKWRGIAIHKYTHSGLFIDRGSSHVTVRNMEIYDNGEPRRVSSGWEPSRPGIRLGGNNHTLDRLIVHDNGEDAIQSLWAKNNLGNITITRSWLYNLRRHPKVNEASNYCTHTDGFQIYDGGVISGITIEESVIGPGFTNGVILGQSRIGNNTWADVQNVTFRNVIFSKSADNGIFGYQKTNSQNWKMENVTLDCTNTKYNCIKIENSRHSVQNSIVYGARVDFEDGLDRYDNNCQWKTDGFALGNTADPMFNSMSANDPFALADYSLATNSPCRGAGASITSVQNLLDNAINPSPAPPTGSSEFACNNTKGTLLEAEDGTIVGRFRRAGGYIEQEVEVDKPWLGGSATYQFTAKQDGLYHLRTLVSAADGGENSFYINFDGQPTVNYMVWDMEPTNGFEERMVSWRGSGTYLDSEFEPMIFRLQKGSHTLIIRGREAKAKLDKICIEPR